MKLCECGCGQPAPLSDRTAGGYTKGQPLRFINHHAWRGRRHSDETRERIRAVRTGTKATPEDRAKMSLSRLGRKHTPERRAAIGAAQLGEANHNYGRRGAANPQYRVPRPESRGANHHNWRGGITNPNIAARATLEYKQWRDQVFKRDSFTCQDCGQVGGKLRAHHIKSFAGHIELRTVLENGVTLCEPCHKDTHRVRKTQTTARSTTCIV